MKTIRTKSGNWYIEIIPDDGARISVLKYDGYDLLTTNSSSFRAPEKFYGDFETRPVFGYDDCFPSVDPCIYPGKEFKIKDHGDLCWQKWNVHINGNSIVCYTDCLKPKTTFKRVIDFSGNELTWRFEVENRSHEKIFFLHIMHALMPLDNIRNIRLPDFKNVIDEVSSAMLDVKNSGELAVNLLSVQPGIYRMFLLREISDGSIKLGLRNGLSLQVDFDETLFPTLGIWWNHSGYPVEEGIQRNECAFEPIPGTCSDLSKSFSDGIYLKADPDETLTWNITWIVN